MAKRPLKGTQCLVIGGAGNLGEEIVEELRERGASVTVFDLAAYSGKNSEVKSIVGDVCSREDLQKAMQGIKTVFHAASVIDIRPVPSPNMRRINVEGTRNVVDCCRACAVEVLVYTSSMEVVTGYGADGRVPDYNGADDEDLAIPAKHCLPYGATKAEAESLVLAANSGELLTCALRPGYIVGPGCIGMQIAMETALGRSDHYVTARLPTKLNCVNARNCAVAHALAAERAEDSRVQGHAFFISDFQDNVLSMTIRAFVDTCIKPILLPLRVAYTLAWLTDRLYRFLHVICSTMGTQLEIPKTVIDIGAVDMAWRNLCFSNKRSQDVLGYGLAPCILVSQEETDKQSRSWATKCYADLKAHQEKRKVK